MRRDGRELRLEDRCYSEEFFRLRLVGRTEVGVDPVRGQAPLGKKAAHLARILCGETETVHPGVEFDVERGSRRGRHIRERAERLSVRNGCGEPVLRRGAQSVCGAYRDQNRGFNCAFTQLNPFFERSDAEEVRHVPKSVRDRSHAVPVGVGFDHDQHPHPGDGAGCGDVAAYHAEIHILSETHFPSVRTSYAARERKMSRDGRAPSRRSSFHLSSASALSASSVLKRMSALPPLRE